tara:strand:+ start:395 stop:622 length:228 start_codon:yes stop_codon:yes gene_type:complete
MTNQEKYIDECMTNQIKYIKQCDELLEDITAQVVELYWDYDRMSRCGKEALDKLAGMVNVPTEKEFLKGIENEST